MSKTRKIYGPPGTGKTTTLVEAGVKIAQVLGPDQLGMVTFTVAAADEIKLRIGQRLGMQPPAGRWERNRYFATRLPWIGTIHSISLRLLGGGLKVITPGSKEMNAFIRSLGGAPSSNVEWAPDDPDSYGWGPGARADDIEDALRVLSMARHRMQRIPEVWNDVPWRRDGPAITPERAEFIAQAYTDYKRQIGMIDFEDMASLGREHMLPVRALLVDEVQDNSPLLWSVTDRWSEGPEYTMLAGDPYQAIYIFSGARPDLFINHPGDLRSLGNSRRLTADAATYAQRLLVGAGYQQGDGWLGSWTGSNTTEFLDGKHTEFWLARTGTLVNEAARWLEEDGIPYGYVRGGGPLQTRAAGAFRSLLLLRRQREISVKLAAGIADNAEPDYFPSYLVSRAKAQAREDPERMVSFAELSTAWGRDLDNPAVWLKRGSYFEHIVRKEGLEPFIVGPRTQVGTIHSAKGREADVVHLVESWGYLPYRATEEPRGARAEACVAYVGVTRHRHRLVMEPIGQGYPYPW
ncbi:MAG TPA: ATP-dependent helicase [Chloroflexota bacterium]|nr:ATP-dependent helicase [Chloroflexota bacterium]